MTKHKLTEKETNKSDEQFVYHPKNIKKKKAHKGHKPNGPHGRAAVHALGRTKTTGNFAKIEKTKGRGAAIGAYQNALASHQGRTAPYHAKAKSGRKMLGDAMKGAC